MPIYDDSLPPPPARPAESHKGTYGSALVIAGSRGMSGAAVLAGLGALRSGTGLVFLAVPEGIQGIVASHEPGYLTVGLPEDGSGRIALGAGKTLAAVIEGKSAVAFGPGLGRSDELKSLAVEWYTHCPLPLVVDADGLNLLAEAAIDWSAVKAPRVFTPHPGEFARLLGTETRSVQQQREEQAVGFAGSRRVTLVLKGRSTVITNGERVTTNQTGNSGLATGGSGDVLTGLIVGLLAQGLEAYDAARLGVYLHGLAADLAADELSEPALTASDLPRYLGAAWKHYLARGGTADIDTSSPASVRNCEGQAG